MRKVTHDGEGRTFLFRARTHTRNKLVFSSVRMHWAVFPMNYTAFLSGPIARSDLLVITHESFLPQFCWYGGHAQARASLCRGPSR